MHPTKLGCYNFKYIGDPFKQHSKIKRDAQYIFVCVSRNVVEVCIQCGNWQFRHIFVRLWVCVYVNQPCLCRSSHVAHWSRCFTCKIIMALGGGGVWAAAAPEQVRSFFGGWLHPPQRTRGAALNCVSRTGHAFQNVSTDGRTWHPHTTDAGWALPRPAVANLIHLEGQI
jgi:hypothetical protein